MKTDFSFLGLKKAILIFNLIIVGINCIYFSITSYCEFYNQKDQIQTPFFITILNIQQDKFVSNYLSLSGSGSGDGFFAPNVLSSSILYIQDDDGIIEVKGNNHDNTLRVGALNSSLLSFELNKSDSKAVIDKIVDERRENYNDLYYKNILSYYIANYNLSNTAKVRLDLFDYPTLKQYNAKNNKGEIKNVVQYGFE
mgnify:CR=1 FL=1